ncbi:MAG: hypothetical protein KG003_13805 [Bacteroidetes bacterium]|nr:hypothetical protein [Bacteroidota bacterium]
METENLDWEKAKKHFDFIRQVYLDLEGFSGVNTSFALDFVFKPLAVRYNNGERTQELFEEMMNVE